MLATVNQITKITTVRFFKKLNIFIKIKLLLVSLKLAGPAQ